MSHNWAPQPDDEDYAVADSLPDPVLAGLPGSDEPRRDWRELFWELDRETHPAYAWGTCLPGSDDQRIGNGFGEGRHLPDHADDDEQLDTYITAREELAGPLPFGFWQESHGWNRPAVPAAPAATPRVMIYGSAENRAANPDGDGRPCLFPRLPDVPADPAPYHWRQHADLERLNTRDIFPFPDMLPGPAVTSDDGIDSADVAAFWDMVADGSTVRDAWATVNGWKLEAAVSDYWRNRPRAAPCVPQTAQEPLPGWPAADGPVRPAKASLASAGALGRPYRRGDMTRARLRRILRRLAAVISREASLSGRLTAWMWAGWS